jgi:hypothetical protein
MSFGFKGLTLYFQNRGSEGFMALLNVFTVMLPERTTPFVSSDGHVADGTSCVQVLSSACRIMLL